MKGHIEASHHSTWNEERGPLHFASSAPWYRMEISHKLLQSTSYNPLISNHLLFLFKSLIRVRFFKKFLAICSDIQNGLSQGSVLYLKSITSQYLETPILTSCYSAWYSVRNQLSRNEKKHYAHDFYFCPIFLVQCRKLPLAVYWSANHFRIIYSWWSQKKRSVECKYMIHTGNWNGNDL